MSETTDDEILKETVYHLPAKINKPRPSNKEIVETIAEARADERRKCLDQCKHEQNSLERAWEERLYKVKQEAYAKGQADLIEQLFLHAKCDCVTEALKEIRKAPEKPLHEKLITGEKR